MALAPAPEHCVDVLVHVRGRGWVVLLGVTLEVLRLRPLTGNEVEAIDIFVPLGSELVRPTHFAPPDPASPI